MNTATFICKLDGFNGDARLFKLNPPAEWNTWSDDGQMPQLTEYVVVSAANVIMSGPETYIFPSNESGEVINWTQMDGSYRGQLNHTKALEGAGYQVQPYTLQETSEAAVRDAAIQSSN